MKINALFISLTALWLGSIVLQCIAIGEDINNGLGWAAIVSTTLVGILPALRIGDIIIIDGFSPFKILHILSSLCSLFILGLLYERTKKELWLIAGFCKCISTTVSHFYFVYGRKKSSPHETPKFKSLYETRRLRRHSLYRIQYERSDEYFRFAVHIITWMLGIVLVFLNINSTEWVDIVTTISLVVSLFGTATNWQPYSRIALMTGSPVVFFLSSVGWERSGLDWNRLVSISVIVYLGLRHSVLKNYYYKLT